MIVLQAIAIGNIQTKDLENIQPRIQFFIQKNSKKQK